MSKRKIFIICLIFLAALTAIRITWYIAIRSPATMQASAGVLDLRQSGMPADKVIQLAGQWEFYPNQLLVDEAEAGSSPAQYIKVPGSWWPAFEALGIETDNYAYATYRLRVLLPPGEPQAYSIRTSRIPGASRLYINGELQLQLGQPSENPDEFEFGDIPHTVTFPNRHNEIEIVIQASTIEPGVSGGIIRAIYLGTPRSIDSFVWVNIAMQHMIIVIFLIHFVYACILYALGVRQSSIVYFAVFILFAALTVLIDDDRLLFSWISFNHKWTRFMQITSYLATAILLLEFIKRLVPEYRDNRWLKTITITGSAYCIFLLFMPGHKMTSSLPFTAPVLTLIPFLLAPMLALRTLLRGDKEGIFLLLGTIAVAGNVLWGSLKSRVLFITGYYPVDTLAAILLFAIFWFRHYIQTSNEAQRLSIELQAADRKKDEFLANTSHELRNPLHGMLNIAQSVLHRSGHALDGAGRRNMRLMIAVGRRMSLMLNDLIDLTRLKDHAIRLNTGPLQLPPVVRGVVDMLHFLTQNKPILFRNRIPEDFPPVVADENRTIQILFNLIHNAVKYTEEGTITIDARIEAGMAVIEIADTGVGIEQGQLEQIFKAYEQADVLGTNGGGGIGLGLSICKQLVELHGGALSVDSEVGVGSTFRFSLPLAQADDVSPSGAGEIAASAQAQFDEFHEADDFAQTAQAQAAEAASADDAGDADNRRSDSPLLAERARPTILAIDDDAVNLIVLKGILPAEEYEIITAPSGKEALSLLEESEFDLVISDVMMPYMSGYELTRIIREQYSLSELPILLLTARNRPEDIESGFLAGANDYVTKPVDGTELRVRVRALTELNRSIREQLRLEAAWLQAQIQPHFLFNTLNAIATLSSVDVERMRELLEQFGAYLRTSFDFINLERLVPLSHELELVHSYLFIEQARFEDRLRVVWEIDQQTSIMIPPLVIQPLVENAVRHGVLKRAEGGEIRIVVERFGEDQAVISVSDNGVGMDKQTLETLLAKKSDAPAGVGLYNTDRRLKQIYSRGLQIRSEPDAGTSVSFIVTL